MAVQIWSGDDILHSFPRKCMDPRGLVALSNSRSFDWGTMPTTARFPQVETRPPSRMPWYHLGYWRSLGELETTSFNCNLNLLIHPEQQLDLWLLIILIPIRNTFLYCSKRCRRSKNNGSAPNRIFRGSIWGWGLRYSDQVAEVIPGYPWGMRPVFFFGWIDGSIFQISPFLDFLGDFWIDLELVPVFPVAIWIWVGKTGFIPTSDKRFFGWFHIFLFPIPTGKSWSSRFFSCPDLTGGFRVQWHVATLSSGTRHTDQLGPGTPSTLK